jgi:PAS domain S-box-containing protein
MSLSDIDTGLFIDVNEQMARFSGYTREEMIGRTSMELGIWASRETRDRAVAAVKSAPRAPLIEVEMHDRHGGVHHVLWSGVQVSMDGRGCLLASSLDITAHRRTEQTLRESEAKYKAVVEASFDLIYVIDSDDTVRYANPAALKALGLAAGQVIGKPRSSFFPPSVAAEQKKGIEKVFATGEPLHREYDMEQEGRVRWNETQLIPLKDRSGKVDAVLGVSRDITKRKRAEDELIQRWQDVLHSERVQTMGQLAASLAHEINQPLMAILSNAQAAGRFLAGANPDLGELREILADIAADGKRAGEVIRRLRSLLRKEPPQRGRIDINAVVLGVVSLARSEAIIKKVSLVTRLAEGLPTACADTVQVEQLLLNLVMNAEQAMAGMPAARRVIALSTEYHASEHEVVVSVSDTGPGIPPDRFEQVFEPFFTTKTGGLGMGLTICRSIAAAHGGRIWAENNPEGGARFRFSLPAADLDGGRIDPPEGART